MNRSQSYPGQCCPVVPVNESINIWDQHHRNAQGDKSPEKLSHLNQPNISAPFPDLCEKLNKFKIHDCLISDPIQIREPFYPDDFRPRNTQGMKVNISPDYKRQQDSGRITDSSE